MFKTTRLIVCVQGLGFVGAAMALAIANAKDKHNNLIYNVIGVELPSAQEKIDLLNKGIFPFETLDSKLSEAASNAIINENFYATSNTNVFSHADIILMDVNLDLSNGMLKMETFKKAAEDIAGRIKENVLIVVETTVPPGTCRYVLKPILENAFKKRNLSQDSILIAHSYERVMPGINYWDSIVNFYRVYSGLTKEATIKCNLFLSNVINVEQYPLTELATVEASEMAKVMENSYRAVNIAFIEEWSRMAEKIGVDLFSVIDAIKKRPTHSNMMQPGFGVGGYCLTKDPLFAELAAHEIFGMNNINFPLSTMSVQINNNMPLVSLNAIEQYLKGLSNKRILVLGVSYRQDIADTRYSPTEIFVREAESRGAIIECHDPLIKYWSELNRKLPDDIPCPAAFDCVIFTVSHKQYLQLDVRKWFKDAKPLVFDANRVLSTEQIDIIKSMNITIKSIGRG